MLVNASLRHTWKTLCPLGRKIHKATINAKTFVIARPWVLRLTSFCVDVDSRLFLSIAVIARCSRGLDQVGFLTPS